MTVEIEIALGTACVATEGSVTGFLLNPAFMQASDARF